MAYNERLYRDIPTGDSLDRFVGRRITRQSSSTVAPPGSNGIFSQSTRTGGSPSCACQSTFSLEHFVEPTATQAEMFVHAAMSNIPISRLASQPALVHRNSQPPSRVWSYQSPVHRSPSVSPRGMPEMQRMHSNTSHIDAPSPRLTRTQQSYINASPPNAREALTMRFIKANMTRVPRPEEHGRYSQSSTQSYSPVQFTRNASAPVTAVLSRTSSIQQQYAPIQRVPPPTYTGAQHPNVVRTMPHRQISEPIGPHPPMSGRQASSIQQEIDALNRALHEFHQSLSISPRVRQPVMWANSVQELQEVPETQAMIAFQSEQPIAETHIMYHQPASARSHMSYHEHIVQPVQQHIYGHAEEHLQYVEPEPMYYTVVQEAQASQPQSPRGLPDEIISQFPVTDFDAAAAEKWSEDIKTCSICLDQYNQGDRIRRLACTHGYHKVCIDSWLSRSTVCPICKFDYEIMLQ